ncbi:MULTISPECIES: RsiV family protein [Vibrio]|uniref:RsiV family protein n=1 Tax=Vibrio TaxID=662 RepID=UPI001EFC11E4|nr:MULTISPECIES: RsiV family protein [Vibrio]MCG8706772.1 RsiV family protein [Vibrio vulnificus]
MLPTKNQWEKWTLPSKMTAVGFYLAVLSIITSIISFVSITGYEALSEQYDIYEVQPSPKMMNDQMSGNYYERQSDISISYPQISSYLDNDFFEILNSEIEASALGYLAENLYEYSFSYSVGITGKHLLSVKMNQYYYYYSAANGNSSTFAINIDPLGSRVIDFYDVFDARRDSLNGIKSLLRSKLDKQCAIFEEKYQQSSYVPRFFINEEGVEFLFSEYEVTPGVCGSFGINISFEKLVSYIKVDGPLGVLVPATGKWQAEEHFLDSITLQIQKHNSDN